LVDRLEYKVVRLFRLVEIAGIIVFAGWISSHWAAEKPAWAKKTMDDAALDLQLSETVNPATNAETFSENGDFSWLGHMAYLIDVVI
jgi:hypothetical protein